MNIYVGNLSFSVTDDQLKNAFSAYGSVDKAVTIKDQDTGRAKGFGFVEMGNNDEALKAIEKLNGSELDGRALRVNEAKPKEDKPRRTSRY